MADTRRDRELGNKVKQFVRTPDFVKARGVQLYAEVGVVEAARRMGVSQKTITRWRHELGIPSRRLQPVTVEDVEVTLREQEKIRLDMRGLLLQKSRLMLGLIDAGMKAEDMKHISAAVGTLLDKYRLEAGESTSRTERHTVDETISRDDHERAALMRTISAELAKRADDAAAGTPEPVASGGEAEGAGDGLPGVRTGPDTVH